MPVEKKPLLVCQIIAFVIYCRIVSDCSIYCEHDWKAASLIIMYRFRASCNRKNAGMAESLETIPNILRLHGDLLRT